MPGPELQTELQPRAGLNAHRLAGRAVLGEPRSGRRKEEHPGREAGAL